MRIPEIFSGGVNKDGMHIDCLREPREAESASNSEPPNLRQLVDSLPSNTEQAVQALMNFKFAKCDVSKGYFEKENDLIVPDSMDELLSLYLDGKIPKDVYYEFNRRGYENVAGGEQK